MLLLVGYPVFWLELYGLHRPGGHTSWLATTLAAGLGLWLWRGTVRTWSDGWKAALAEFRTWPRREQILSALGIGLVAGLLLVVAWRMFDRAMFHLLLHPSTRVDFAVIAAVVIVAQVGLIAASVTGIVLAILLFIRDQIRGSVIMSKVDLRAVHSKRRRLVDERDLLDQHGQ